MDIITGIDGINTLTIGQKINHAEGTFRKVFEGMLTGFRINDSGRGSIFYTKTSNGAKVRSIIYVDDILNMKLRDGTLVIHTRNKKEVKDE